jgi:archaellum component FlaC
MPNNFNESERSQDSLVEIQTLKERLKELRNQLDLLLKSVEDLDNHSDRNTANIVRKTLSQQIQVLEMKFEETERKILSLTSKKPTSNEVTNRLKLLEFVIFGIKKQIEEKSREIEEFKNNGKHLFILRRAFYGNTIEQKILQR